MSLYDGAVELGLKAAKAVSKGEIPTKGLDLPNIDALGLTAPMKKGLDEVPKSVAPSTPSFEGLQGLPTPAVAPKARAKRTEPYQLTEPEFADDVVEDTLPVEAVPKSASALADEERVRTIREVAHIRSVDLSKLPPEKWPRPVTIRNENGVAVDEITPKFNDWEEENDYNRIMFHTGWGRGDESVPPRLRYPWVPALDGKRLGTTKVETLSSPAHANGRSNPWEHGGEKSSMTEVTLKDGRKVILSSFRDDNGNMIMATDKATGKEIGSVLFSMDTDAGVRINPTVSVVPEFRRLGLATEMYRVAEAVGGKIPSYDDGGIRTPLGDAFRAGMEGKKPRPNQEHQNIEDTTIDKVPKELFEREPVILDPSGMPHITLDRAMNRSLNRSRGVRPIVDGEVTGKEGAEIYTDTIQSDAILEKNAKRVAGLDGETSHMADAEYRAAFEKYLRTVDTFKRERERHKGSPSARIFMEDGKVYMDIGLDKNIKGTGEGADIYNGLYSFAKAQGIVVGPSHGLTKGNTVLKNVNMASGLLKIKDSSLIEANVEQFMPIAFRGEGSYAEVGQVIGIPAKKLLEKKDMPDMEKFFADYQVEQADQYTIHSTMVSYLNYWNPLADGTRLEVTKARANNLLVSFMTGIDKGVVPGLGSSKQKEMVAEVKKRLKEAYDYEIEDALVEVTEVDNATFKAPVLNVLKDMVKDEKWKKILPGLVGTAIFEDITDAEDANDPGA